jgi:hypothetical protein
MLAKFAQQFDFVILADLKAAHDKRSFQPRPIELSNEHAQHNVSGMNFDWFPQQRNPIYDATPKAPSP